MYLYIVLKNDRSLKAFKQRKPLLAKLSRGRMLIKIDNETAYKKAIAKTRKKLQIELIQLIKHGS